MDTVRLQQNGKHYLITFQTKVIEDGLGYQKVTLNFTLILKVIEQSNRFFKWDAIGFNAVIDRAQNSKYEHDLSFHT